MLKNNNLLVRIYICLIISLLQYKAKGGIPPPPLLSGNVIIVKAIHKITEIQLYYETDTYNIKKNICMYMLKMIKRIELLSFQLKPRCYQV